MQAWKRRLEQLARKEARCPACAKAARLNAETNEPKICSTHQTIRHRMVFKPRRFS